MKMTMKMKMMMQDRSSTTNTQVMPRNSRFRTDRNGIMIPSLESKVHFNGYLQEKRKGKLSKYCLKKPK